MTGLIGNFSLAAAVLVSLLALFTALAAARFESASLLRWSKSLLVALFGVFTVGSIALSIALVNCEFAFDYVARYTERALPFGYKLAAFWAGQEGSLLLWAWLLAGMSALCGLTLKQQQAGPSGSPSRQSPILEHATVLATLSIVCGFFAFLMLFAANPFKVSDVIPADGHGLNPMLQDPGMIAHPPTLFLGYAGYTIPFALLVGALLAGRRDNEWLAPVRRWAVFSWLLLSIGILLGAQWAYVELGWGGYWAWDPVENASLLPWLTGTALLHSIVIQQNRGMFKKWNAWLIAATFILCIVGTYITRSGVIDSVHSFGRSLIGTFFLVFLLIAILFSVAIIAIRSRFLRSEHELEALMGKEGFFLATNVLLVGMTIVTLVGTMFPVISELLAGQKVTVGPSFYNKVVAPLGLVLVALMSVGPLLVYGRDAVAKLARGAIIPAIIAIITVAVFLAMGLRNIWALIAAGVASCALASILVDLIRSTVARIRTHSENPLVALLKLLDNNHRRYGGQVVHVGVIMIVVGVTASSLFEQKQDFVMKQGESVHFAGRRITLSGLETIDGPNFVALQATLTVTEPDGATTTAAPQIRKYEKWEQLNSEVSINSSWRQDLYLTLAASDGHGGVTIQAIVNPLVSWIWTGGVVLTVGGVICLLPRLLPQPATAPAPATDPNTQSRIQQSDRRRSRKSDRAGTVQATA
ncbi:heme lyase CcmF/NrfE family subunit [Fontivita pretiosa]|uniref:heme lyase CcmF/NrfE family subunit n=1 Tax=Fontivita pretiosa TaxID=2989684 RepID=UPI003D168A4B